MFSWIREIVTAGIFYMPFLAFIGFGLFVLVIGISTLITGTIVFLALGIYGLYAVLRDTGLIEKAIQQIKVLFHSLDLDIINNIDKSFVLKDLENIPERNALFLCHPHGIMGLSWFYHLCHPFTPWPHSSKRPYLAIHSLLFKIPLLREILHANRFIDSSRESIQSYLEKGESVALFTGGAEEMIHTDEHVTNIIMKKRKGYSRIAKDARVPLVILFNTNENRYFPQNTFFLWKWLTQVIFHYTRISFPLPSWKAMTNWISLMKQPLEDPIATFTLKPIETQGKSYEAIQKECISRVETFIQEKGLQATIVG
jgi:hypothetical protein